MENIVDCYQVMKFAGDELDHIELTEENNKRYWDLNNLWWDAATLYVPRKKLEISFSAN